MKNAAKKKVAKKKVAATNGEGTRGRPSSMTGKKLFKLAGKEHGLREGGRRLETYSSIKEGMKFDSFAAAGGNLSDLANLVKNGKVEAR